MTCTKQISMTGYLVRYVDLREAKPRAAHESVYVIDKDALAALGLLGLNVADFITARYERGGNHVIGVECVPNNRAVEINLLKFWQNASPETPGESEVPGDA